jgi:hypothetical protein
MWLTLILRREGIADPGGICLSEDAYRQVRDRLKEEFVDVGEKTLKNIARPVRAYAIKTGSTGSQVPPQVSASTPPRLSIVVLPFANLGGDPEQEYFVDGVTESLNICAESGEDRVQSNLKVREHHFTIHKQDATGLWCIPPENRPATRNGQANRQAEPGFPDPSWGVQHRETSLGQNRGQQHFPWRHLKSQKVLKANRLKRLDDGRAISPGLNHWLAGANGEDAFEEIHHARHHTLTVACPGCGSQAASAVACLSGSF